MSRVLWDKVGLYRLIQTHDDILRSGLSFHDFDDRRHRDLHIEGSTRHVDTSQLLIASRVHVGEDSCTSDLSLECPCFVPIPSADEMIADVDSILVQEEQCSIRERPKIPPIEYVRKPSSAIVRQLNKSSFERSHPSTPRHVNNREVVLSNLEWAIGVSVRLRVNVQV